MPTTVVTTANCTESVNIGTLQVTLNCAIGTMANGASTTIKFTVVPTTAGLALAVTVVVVASCCTPWPMV